MRIGITEGGDAGIDFTWETKIGKVDGAVLITKEITDALIEKILFYQDKIILHATCTGYGGTVLEPFVPKPETQMAQLKKLEDAGFPKEQVVIRIDPIVPTKKGVLRAQRVVDLSHGLTERYRVSVLDMYPHVRERFHRAGLPLPYGERFHASPDQFSLVDRWLGQQDIVFECCAEPNLRNAEHCGCVSGKDLSLLGLKLDKDYPSGFQRRECLCFSCKRATTAAMYHPPSRRRSGAPSTSRSKNQPTCRRAPSLRCARASTSSAISISVRPVRRASRATVCR